MLSWRTLVLPWVTYNNLKALKETERVYMVSVKLCQDSYNSVSLSIATSVCRPHSSQSNTAYSKENIKLFPEKKSYRKKTNCTLKYILPVKTKAVYKETTSKLTSLFCCKLQKQTWVYWRIDFMNFVECLYLFEKYLI